MVGIKGRLAVAYVILLVSFALGASSQTSRFSDFQSSPSINLAVLDSIGTYRRSEFGRRIEEENQRAIKQLEQQNRFFDCVLTVEENRLLQLKPTLNEDEFNELRVRFAATAERRRGSQDEKENQLTEWYRGEQSRYQNALASMTQSFANREGVNFVVESNQVVFFDTRFDLTELFIRLMNSEFGDGRAGPNYQPALALIRLTDDNINVLSENSERCRKEWPES